MTPEVKIDLGIEGCLRFVDDVVSRRDKRKENFLDNLNDDLEVISKVISTLDNLFIDLAGGFANKDVVENPVRLQAHVEETFKYLRRRELLPILEERLGALNTAAYDERLQSKVHREMVLSLRSLVRRLAQYRDELGRGTMTGVGQKQDWNLVTLRECAQGYRQDIPVAIQDVAEEVLRNHDFDLSDNIHRLVGALRQHIKMAAI
jgi:hypothetical protein